MKQNNKLKFFPDSEGSAPKPKKGDTRQTGDGDDVDGEGKGVCPGQGWLGDLVRTGL